MKVWYGNVAHPRLSNYVKGHNWLNHSGDYLMFPPDEWEFKGGARHYVESIDEVIVGPSHLDQIQATCMQKKHLNSFGTLFDSLNCKLSLLSWLI